MVFTQLSLHVLAPRINLVTFKQWGAPSPDALLKPVDIMEDSTPSPMIQASFIQF